MGLSLAGRQPLTSTQYQPSSFNVRINLQNYNTQMGGYGSYASASRPQLGQAGPPNWVSALEQQEM